MSSPDTPQGSISPDLNLSKLWLCNVLRKLDLVSFDNVYILGSWYGSMGLFLISKHIQFSDIYNIDISNQKTQTVAHMLKRMHLNNHIHAVCMDANELQYHGHRILVINTSTNDIAGVEWFDTIPSGSCIVLQGKDHQDNSNGIETLSAFDFEYPMDRELFLSKLLLRDMQGNNYHRFMKIGIK